MSIITKMRKQTAVYWALSSYDEYGQPTWDSPVEIECRWEDKSEEFIVSDGTRQVSNAIVYVDRDMEGFEMKIVDLTIREAEKLVKFRKSFL